MDELEESLGYQERKALNHHRDSMRFALLHNWLSFEPGGMHPFQHAIPIPETYGERLGYFAMEGAKSALLGFWLHQAEFADAKRFRDDEINPMLRRRSEPEWSVKQRRDHANGSRLRFFIAKSKLGTFDTDAIDTDFAAEHLHEHADILEGASVVERRTFAAYGMDGAEPRPIDMTHALGVSPRHPRDERTVVLAPTSTSFYAFRQTPAEPAGES